MRHFGKRVLAGALDLLLLGGIDAAVVYFTVRLADLPFAAAAQLPAAPLLADTRVVRAQ